MHNLRSICWHRNVIKQKFYNIQMIVLTIFHSLPMDNMSFFHPVLPYRMLLGSVENNVAGCQAHDAKTT